MTSSSNSTRRRNRQVSHEKSSEKSECMPATLRPTEINHQTSQRLRSFLVGAGKREQVIETPGATTRNLSACRESLQGKWRVTMENNSLNRICKIAIAVGLG